ncbi:hypothetical protein M426DRAFT_9826 [Hypoxylon sp. CI-4A]|nr:hypothetical protein M426DRAFT_9826 [Hypoxylon sp. CI-4A]
MSSRNHLDATSGREVVYCHQCQHEWYKDERPNIVCPMCDSEVTEIVSPSTDPRNIEDDNSHRPPRFSRFDSETDDDDFEEDEIHGPGGFFGHRAIHHTFGGPRSDPERRRTAPDNSDQIIRRFTEMLGDMGGPSMVGRSTHETLFASPPPRVTLQRFSGPGFTGGISSFTISAGPARPRPDATRGEFGTAAGPGADDPFQRIFGDIMGAMGPPPLGRDAPNQNNGEGNGRQDFSLALSQLIASLINPQMVHGDAVYSQEALDRIITNLMEANPQSNAPAPASEEAIDKLPRKKLDEAMLGPELKGECTICIDEMKEGDEAIVLPCKHWFHEQCVVLWLKQHNTCPICRAAIDGEASGRSDGASSSAQAGPSSASSPFRPSQPTRMRSEQFGFEPSEGSRRNSNSPPTYSRSTQPTRIRSPSPSSRRATPSERNRDTRGSSSSGPFSWLRGPFTRDRRS